jgi:hypothetical protein
VEKPIKEVRDKKATADDDVLGDVLRLLSGRRWSRNNDTLINNMYETGGWPKNLIKVTITALKEKPKATKCSDHRTLSLIAHIGRRVSGALRGMIERKIEDVLGEDQFGFRK